MLTTQGDDRAHSDAGRLHVDQQERNAFLDLGGGIGANEEETPIGMLRHRRPGLLAVDAVIFLAVITGETLGAGAQRCKIGTGAGFGITLAPPILATQDARQELGFLFRRAEGVDHRANHRQAERHQAHGIGSGGLFRPDITLGGGPAGAAIFGRPRRHDPALLVQHLVPGEEIFLRHFLALVNLLIEIGGIMVADESTHFVTKGIVFGAEIQIHGFTSQLTG